MTLETYYAYLLVVAVFFLSPPGPSQLLMVSNAMSWGVSKASPTIAGDLTANALQMTAAAFGLATIIAQSASALTVIKWAGVAYLLWMGFQKFRAVPAQLGGASDVKTPAPGNFFRQGFFTSAANPKAVFFFAALFPQFIDPQQAIWFQLLVLGVTYIVIDGILLFVYGTIAARSVSKLKALSGKVVNRLSGGMMIGAAGLLAARDVSTGAR